MRMSVVCIEFELWEIDHLAELGQMFVSGN